jgi:2-polyprenyl-3-methyl-5-hydroxy-6-metoxy-1,4-benzoquinol methylase
MVNLKSLLATSNDPHSLGGKFRSKRFAFFEELFWKTFKGEKKITILDLGGTEEFWKDKKLIHDKRVTITLLNLEKSPVTTNSLINIAGDATDLSAFDDQSFDLVFSNSVIEHLYTYENQKNMASEIRRVGKKYFVQTPNKYFFIEPHYALPLVQFLPRTFVFFILTKTKLSRMKKWDPTYAQNYLEEIRLLSLQEMQQLFPDGKVFCEKFLGMKKSFTLHNF